MNSLVDIVLFGVIGAVMLAALLGLMLLTTGRSQGQGLRAVFGVASTILLIAVPALAAGHRVLPLHVGWADGRGGAVAELAESTEGVHVVRVVERRWPPVDPDSDFLKLYLREQRIAAEDAYLDSLVRASRIERREDRVARARAAVAGDGGDGGGQQRQPDGGGEAEGVPLGGGVVAGGDGVEVADGAQDEGGDG